MMTITAILSSSCNDNPFDEYEKASVEIQETFSIDGNAGTHRIPFTITNPSKGTQATASTSSQWIFDLVVTDDNKVEFSVYDNFSSPRSARITVSYGEGISASVDVTQDSFGFAEFSVEFSAPTTRGITATITPLSHEGNYFFEVMSKAGVDNYLALDEHNPGDMDYGNALYLSDFEFLKESAEENGSTLEHYLHSLTSMYKMTESGEPVQVPYSTLKADTEYYLVVYGMDHEGRRTTAINLFLFKTEALEYSDMTFTARTTHILQNQVSFAITPSNATATYYWTYISETDFQKYSLDFIMSNMISGLLSDAAMSGYSTEQYLSLNLNKGTTVETQGNLMTNTTYHVIVWGMDLTGTQTTEPFDVLEFTTSDHAVTDDCTFKISVVETEAMDIKIKVEPTSADTKYYVAFIDEARCDGYNDSQMVERTLNMETSRIKDGYYGIDVTWDNFKYLYSGTKELWGRRDLSWTFEPEHNYHIYVFGVSSKGKCTTRIHKIEHETIEADESQMTFGVTIKEPTTWDKATFTITPSNDEEFWLPFLIPTADLTTYRYANGDLMDDEVMAQIKDYYEDEITQYVFSGTKEYTTKWFSETEYTLLVFGYAGTNTTQIYEYSFTSPEIPFDRADVDVDVRFELFRGSDLKALAPDVWSDVEDGDCVMISRMSTTGNPAHWYVGLWPPVENFKDSGGRDHLVTLNMSPDSPPGDVWIDKTFYRTRPWWYGSTKDHQWSNADGTITLPHMPWSLSYFAADAQGNFGPWNYELFIPVPLPKDQVKEPYHVGYTQAYNFWSGSASKTMMKIFSVNTGKEIQIK